MNAHDRILAHGRVRVVAAGDGPPLLLVHGLGGSWRNWEANIPELAERHRVIALDLPGFGGSPPSADGVTIERHVDTMIELLDEFGVARAIVVGNSFGGLLAIEAAARHPARVASAVLVCSGGLPLDSLRHRLVLVPASTVLSRSLRRRRVRRLLIGRPRPRRRLAGWIFHDPAAIPEARLETVLGGLAAPGFTTTLRALRPYDARLRASLVGCPTLIVWGRRDPLLPVSMGHRLHRLVADSRLVVWERVGHAPMLEAPQAFNQLLAAFVAETWTERVSKPSPPVNWPDRFAAGDYAS